jgi:carbon-monoxide dehydrogenase large subunit
VTCNKTGASKTIQEIAGRIVSRDEASAEHRARHARRQHFWEPPNFTFPFGTHLVVTEVERETGAIKILRYVAVDDIGNILNPLIVDGQIHGGVAARAGTSAVGRSVYDGNAQLVTGEFMDYAMPRAHMMPWIESSHTITPTPVNPLGVKGVGEAGTIGCSPAVVNSVVDALSPLGVKHIDMPMTPEKSGS